MTPRRVVFEKLQVNQTIRHANGTSYLIVRTKPPAEGGVQKVWARWRNGLIGRFGKEVVRISPAHVVGFLHYRARKVHYTRVADRDPPEA